MRVGVRGEGASSRVIVYSAEVEVEAMVVELAFGESRGWEERFRLELAGYALDVIRAFFSFFLLY